MRRISIRNRELERTDLLDDFFHYIASRRAIYLKRAEGSPKPWTNDMILRKYRFSNVYRVTDKLSQFIIAHIISHPSTGRFDIEDQVFRILLFRLFNSVTCADLDVINSRQSIIWKFIEFKLGRDITWETFDFLVFNNILTKAKEMGVLDADQNRVQLFCFKDNGRLGHNSDHANRLEFVKTMMVGDLVKKLTRCTTATDAHNLIQSFHKMDSHFAYQLLLDLSYTGLFDYSIDDFVVLRGTTRSILRRFYVGETKGIEKAILENIQKTQMNHFMRLGLDFNLVEFGGVIHVLQCSDIEHSLHQFERYVRCRERRQHDTVELIGNLLKITFMPPLSWYISRPTNTSRPPQRRKRRAIFTAPKSTKKLKQPEPTWDIERIVDVKTEGGKRKFLIEWEGYSEQTWEPEWMVRADVPEMVEEYLEERERLNSR
ncbi:hypothetical protein PROFUN_03163 [Planoprotostelium fungivorum]|uniref:Chromo domain-containing protein n=1 Tax=Planoprotostelium fungivorum TaxID=1890364 RepID=A0A2P6NWZ1_9EUKA|nr:hypothetical protein PROFUN_03163 [Planoprotostelium fungivorum]